MFIPALMALTLVLLVPAGTEAVCNLCVFPILAATGAAASASSMSWASCFLGGVFITLFVLYIDFKFFKNGHHLDASPLTLCLSGIVGVIVGIYYKNIDLFFYLLAGCAFGHLLLTLHCIIRQYKKIPYLRAILVNGLSIFVGVMPYVININLVVFSIVVVVLHAILFLLRIGLLFQEQIKGNKYVKNQ